MVADALRTQAALATQTLLPKPTVVVDENRERVRDREGGNKMREKQGNFKELVQPSDDCDHPHDQTNLESDKRKDKFGSVDHSHTPRSVPVASLLTKPEISKSRYVSSHCHATHARLNNFAVLPTISSLSI